MRLQLIASEVAQISEPATAIRELYDSCEKIQTVSTVDDINTLTHILSVDIRELRSKKFEPISLPTTELKVKVTKAYYDPNSVTDNFI